MFKRVTPRALAVSGYRLTDSSKIGRLKVSAQFRGPRNVKWVTAPGYIKGIRRAVKVTAFGFR